MPKLALTDRACASVKAIGTRTDFFDVLVPGLALRVTDKGHRSWSFTFTSPHDGKRARATLGTYPATGLAAARGQAIELRAGVERGEDPRLLSDRKRGGMIVSDMAAAYLDIPNRKTGKVRKRISEVRRRLVKNVLPIIGDVKISELHRRDITRCLDPVIKRGSPIEAARVFQDIRAMVRWGVGRGDLDTNPIEGMQGPPDSVPRDRVLTDDEIHTLWHTLPEVFGSSSDPRVLVLQLCLITAQRISEVAGMMVSELDMKTKEWHLPASRTKNGHDHVIPLSTMALNILRDASAVATDGALFACRPAALAGRIFRANKLFGIASWSAHDLRRTALTGMARLGVAPIVLGHVANHRSTTRAGVTLQVYSQHPYTQEKRAALDLWAERLTAIVGGGAANVLPIRSRKASQ